MDRLSVGSLADPKGLTDKFLLIVELEACTQVKILSKFPYTDKLQVPYKLG